MKIIKVLYNNQTSFILDIVNKHKGNNIVEYFNYNLYKERKKMIPIQTKFGSKNLPLIVFEDENMKEYSVIWSERNPDWESEIIKNLNYE